MDRDLEKTAEYEVRSPRPSVVAAIEHLGLIPGMTVLDAGCGAGVHLPLFARRVGPGGQVTGIDIDEERLSVARNVCRDYVDEGWVALQQADITALPFPHATFDAAWSSLVLHHFDGMGQLIAELARVVKPGGLVGILEGDHHGSFPLLPWPAEFELRVRSAILRGEQERHAGELPAVPSGYVARFLPRLLLDAGLTYVHMHAVADVYHAPLDAVREDLIRDGLLSWFDQRAREWLDPVDWERLVAYLGPQSPNYLLSRPDFFVSRTWFLCTGRVKLEGA